MAPLSEERLALASTVMWASDISAAADLYPATWKKRSDPESLMAQKLGQAPAFEGNAKTDRGNWMEPVIAGKWSEQTGRKVRRNADPETGESISVIHPTITIAGATVDYFTDDAEADILECKYVGLFPAKNWTAESPPVWVLAQVQWQLGVLQKKRAHVAAFLEGCPLSSGVDSWTVNFDEALWTKLVFIAQEFMERVNRLRTEAA